MSDDLINQGRPAGTEPADLADQLERLPAESARDILRQRPPAEAAAILTELELVVAAALLDGFSTKEIASWLQLVPPNVAADLIGALPATRREAVLSGLAPDKSASVAALLRYPLESAGGIMDNRFIAARADQTVEEFLTLLRARPAHRTDDVSYIYVVDGTHKLVGVVSLRDLIFGSGQRRVSEIMNRNVTFLRVTDDQEEIARQMQHYHFLGLPVVDEQERLAGVVKMRDALRIASDEATEDMQLMVGLSGEERLRTPWHLSIARRLPWLGVNLGTALGAVTVVSFFEGTLSRWTGLVPFLPLISAVAGNGGNQALTVIIRSLALGEVASGDASRALRKELFIGAVNGLALAVAIGLIAFAWKGSLPLGIVAGAAMLVNQILGALAGVAIPFGLRWCKVDPAMASSIFVTALTDTMGFLVFLGLATAAMRAFGI